MEQRHPIQVQEIKPEQLDSHTYVRCLHVFTLSPTQLLERKEPAFRVACLIPRLPCHSLGIQHKALNIFSATTQTMGNLHDQIRVLDAHVFRVPAEHTHLQLPIAAAKTVHLCTLTIVFVLARKSMCFEPVKYLADGLCRLRQHRFEWYTWRKLQMLLDMLDAVLQERGYQQIVRRHLTEHCLDRVCALLKSLRQFRCVIRIASIASLLGFMWLAIMRREHHSLRNRDQHSLLC